MTTEAALAPLRERIERYYSGKVERHGATPEGVDWSCAPTQELRFVQLLRLVDFSRSFSLDDVGCGYGALLGFIARRHRGARMDYLGIDLSPAMVGCARRLWATRANGDFIVGAGSPRVSDYAVASGIFNVRIDEAVPMWEALIQDTLRTMASASRTGFAVNFLTQLPPGMQGKPELYRTEPGRWVDFCEQELKTSVTLLDAYGMREFTLLARH